jgi:hypothetical protein
MREAPGIEAPTFANCASQPGTRQGMPLRPRALGGCGPPGGSRHYERTLPRELNII